MRSKQSSLKRAQNAGIDTTLLEINLKKTYTERFKDNESAWKLAQMLALAGTKYYAKSRKTN